LKSLFNRVEEISQVKNQFFRIHKMKTTETIVHIWDEVSKKKLGLKEEISMFISSKNITSGQYDKLLQ
jgi:hypothetical protein